MIDASLFTMGSRRSRTLPRGSVFFQCGNPRKKRIHFPEATFVVFLGKTRDLGCNQVLVVWIGGWGVLTGFCRGLNGKPSTNHQAAKPLGSKPPIRGKPNGCAIVSLPNSPTKIEISPFTNHNPPFQGTSKLKTDVPSVPFQTRKPFQGSISGTTWEAEQTPGPKLSRGGASVAARFARGLRASGGALRGAWEGAPLPGGGAAGGGRRAAARFWPWAHSRNEKNTQRTSPEFLTESMSSRYIYYDDPYL